MQQSINALTIATMILWAAGRHIQNVRKDLKLQYQISNVVINPVWHWDEKGWLEKLENFFVVDDRPKVDGQIFQAF